MTTFRETISPFLRNITFEDSQRELWNLRRKKQRRAYLIENVNDDKIHANDSRSHDTSEHWFDDEGDWQKNRASKIEDSSQELWTLLMSRALSPESLMAGLFLTS